MLAWLGGPGESQAGLVRSIAYSGICKTTVNNISEPSSLIPQCQPPSKKFPEAHLNFCHQVFSSVGLFFLANMKQVLINDIPTFMALPFVFLIYFPYLHNSSLSIPVVPRLFISCIIHPSLLSPFNTGFWEMCISLNSFFSFCLALICTQTHTSPAPQLPAVESCWEHYIHGRAQGRTASMHPSPSLGKDPCSFSDQSLAPAYPEG